MIPSSYNQYKTVSIKTSQLKYWPFIKGLFFCGLFVVILIRISEGESLGYLVFVALLFLLMAVINLSEAFTSREKKTYIKKTDDEILEELIALEELAKKNSLVNNQKSKIDQKLPKTNSFSSKAKENKWGETQISNLDKSISLSKLINNNGLDNIYYADILNCFEWKYKRLTILIRDKFTCKKCGDINQSNHIHHKFYIWGNLPWIIEDEGLVTLCEHCHRIEHETKEIPVYNILKSGEKDIRGRFWMRCRRCDGHGYIGKYEHVQKGNCFKCNGLEIRKDIFKKALNNFQSNVYNYNEDQLRNDYRDYLQKLSYKDIDSIPELKKQTSSKDFKTNSFIDYDEIGYGEPPIS